MEELRRDPRGEGSLARDPRGRVRRAGRAVGQREEHGVAHARGPRAHRRGPDPHRRPGREQHRPGGTRRRDGLPVVRALPAHDGVRQPRVQPAEPASPKAGDRRARPAGGRDPPALGAAEAQAEAALGRPAAACRARPRDRPRAGRVSDGRAALEPRREAPRRDARRAAQAPAASRDDDGLRHPRPGRGDDDG